MFSMSISKTNEKPMLLSIHSSYTSKYLQQKYTLTPHFGPLDVLQQDLKHIDLLRLEIQSTKYKVSDLLQSIEIGNIPRVIAHMKEKTPSNETVSVHRILTESWDPMEYAILCKRYDIATLLKMNGVQASNRLIQESATDEYLKQVLSN